jgi:hypothetical protein
MFKLPEMNLNIDANLFLSKYVNNGYDLLDYNYTNHFAIYTEILTNGYEII